MYIRARSEKTIGTITCLRNVSLNITEYYRILYIYYILYYITLLFISYIYYLLYIIYFTKDSDLFVCSPASWLLLITIIADDNTDENRRMKFRLSPLFFHLYINIQIFQLSLPPPV